MREHESFTPPSCPLFEKRMAYAPVEDKATTASESLEKWGPSNGHPGSADMWSRPAPGWARWFPTLARCSSNGHLIQKLSAWPKFCSKRHSKFFQRISKLRKYFWYFCKKKKVLEQFQHAEKYFVLFVFKIMQWRKIKRVKNQKNSNGGKGKYEINTIYLWQGLVV